MALDNIMDGMNRVVNYIVYIIPEINKISSIKSTVESNAIGITTIDGIVDSLYTWNKQQYLSQYPNGYNGNLPISSTRYGGLQITNIANTQYVIVNTTKYIFVTELGTPGDQEVHVKIQDTIMNSTLKLRDAVLGLGYYDPTNVRYGTNVVLAYMFHTTQKVQIGTTGLSIGNNLIFYQQNEGAALPFSTNVTGTLIAPTRGYYFRYVFDKNSTQMTGSMQTIITPDASALGGFDREVKSISFSDSNITTTEKEMDLYMSLDEVTFIPVYLGIETTFTSSTQTKQMMLQTPRIPAGYGLYIAGRSSGTNNNEYASFKLEIISYNLSL